MGFNSGFSGMGISPSDQDKLNNEAKDMLLFGNNAIGTSTSSRYLSPGYENSLAQTSVIQLRSSVFGILKNFYIRHNSVGTGINNIIYSLRINNVVSSLIITMLPTSSDGSNLVNEEIINVGDLIDILVTKSGTIGSSPQDIIATLEVKS